MYIRPRFELTIVVNTYAILRTCTYVSHMPAHVAGCVAAHAQDGDTDENSPVVRLLVYACSSSIAFRAGGGGRPGNTEDN